MQLVYLYIENYKNIKKQGFNFSPRFKCSFEDGVLSIDKNKNYKSIFPENISITAIVGKNGSGKSALLEIITFGANKYELLRSKVLLVVYDNNKLFYITNFSKVDIDSNLEIERDDRILTDRVLFECNYNEYLNNFFKRLTDLYYFIYHLVEVYCYFPNIENSLKDKFKFDYFICKVECIKFRLKEELVNYEGDISDLNSKINNLEYKFKNIIYRIFSIKRTFFTLNVSFTTIEETLVYNLLVFYIRFISRLLIEKEKNIEILNIFFKEISKFSNYKEIFKFNFKVWFEKSIKSYSLDLEYLKFLKSVLENYMDSFNYIKKMQKSFVHKNNVFFLFFSLIENKKIKDFINYTEVLTGIRNPSDYFYTVDGFSYDFVNINNNIKYSDLSSGEKIILKYIVEVLFFYLESNIKIILLDEPDNHLHPEWKREFLELLFSSLENLSDKFHLILTTHSPFILSDIPKENIIFLKDGKNVSDEVEIDTFGANIHTLLSHGFFMKDGLMGEFAKKKINEVIKFLNDKDSEIKDKDKAQNVINLIGEPIIKNQLQKMLNSKKLDKIDEIEKEIELLKHRLEILRKNSSV